MGQSIAEMLAYKGMDVYMLELSSDKLEQGIQNIESSLDKQIEKWALTQAEKKLILNRINRAESMEELQGCEFIIETISEDLEAKKEVITRDRRDLPSGSHHCQQHLNAVSY